MQTLELGIHAPIITTDSEYDRWWREIGQFLQPADIASPEQLELFRLFGAAVYADRSEEIGLIRADAQANEDESTKSATRAKGAMSDIENVLSETISDAEKMSAVQKLINDYNK
jgi:hypothetical protein